ncbi:MAG TPA: nucleotidyltransferase family protein [Longimicrobium sp.]
MSPMETSAVDLTEAERLLASLVCGRADPREVSAPDAAALAPLALAHGLGPMLFAAVQDAGIAPAGTPWVPLAGYARDAATRYLLARVEQGRIEAALGAAGIEWVWLKGYALAHTVYPRPALRPMKDLDLLVPPERCDDAERAVLALGYRPAADAPLMFRGGGRVSHHLPTLRSPSGLLVEMHTSLHPSQLLRVSEHLHWFRAQVVETEAAGVRVRHFTPEAQLLHLAAHAILQHGEAERYLQRFLDCHLVVAGTPRLDWDVVLRQAAALDWTYALHRALTRAREHFDTPVPDHVLLALAERGTRATRATNLAVALARPGADEPTERARVIGTAQPLHVRLYVGLRTVVPSPAYMRWRYAAKAWELPGAYLRRWWGIARRILGGRSRG